MSRFYDNEYEMEFPNQAEFWHANAQRALKGRKGRKALAELRDALLALPEKRLIAGAMCTVGGVEHPSAPLGRWSREDYEDKLAKEGEGVCAIGAFLWYRKVKAGTDPAVAFDLLPVLLDSDGDGDWQTAEMGRKAGLTMTLAWTLAYRNDSTYEAMTPEERYEAFLKWIDEQLAEQAVA
jgi:hypothetical protein